MTAYLLGTQALVDSARNNTTPVHRWAAAEHPDEDDVVASVASFTLSKASEALERAASSSIDALYTQHRPTIRRILSHTASARHGPLGITPTD